MRCVIPFLCLALSMESLIPIVRAQDSTADGWASVEPGTRGGEGGTVIDVRDAEAITKAVAGDAAKIVRVHGTISLKNAVKVGSNTTIAGVGSDAKLVGGGLHVRKVNNVIVRNLAISGASDAVSVEESHHLWIDHCDFSDCKDGLVDIKRGSDFITVSWNHFHKHHKTCLLGHSDKPDIQKLDKGKLRVSYHHNDFDGTKTRHPRVRFAEGVHVYNNYYRGNEYGVASVMDAGVIVEGNYFEEVEQPTLTAYGDSPEPGRLIERQNVFIKSGKPQTRGVVEDSAIKYHYHLDEASEIREIVMQGAGTGRLEK